MAPATALRERGRVGAGVRGKEEERRWGPKTGDCKMIYWMRWREEEGGREANIVRRRCGTRQASRCARLGR